MVYVPWRGFAMAFQICVQYLQPHRLDYWEDRHPDPHRSCSVLGPTFPIKTQ